jgi:hypothetical protein
MSRRLLTMGGDCADIITNCRDVDAHYLVYETARERTALQSALKAAVGHEMEMSEIGKYSGDTGGVRLVTREIYDAIQNRAKVLSAEKMDKYRVSASSRELSKIIHEEMGDRKNLASIKQIYGLTEPLYLSTVTIDKIIRGTYKSQLRNLPSQDEVDEVNKQFTGFNKDYIRRRDITGFKDMRRFAEVWAMRSNPAGMDDFFNISGMLAGGKLSDSIAKERLTELFDDYFSEYNLGWPDFYTAANIIREVRMAMRDQALLSELSSDASIRRKMHRWTDLQKNNAFESERPTSPRILPLVTPKPPAEKPEPEPQPEPPSAGKIRAKRRPKGEAPTESYIGVPVEARVSIEETRKVLLHWAARDARNITAFLDISEIGSSNLPEAKKAEQIRQLIAKMRIVFPTKHTAAMMLSEINDALKATLAELPVVDRRIFNRRPSGSGTPTRAMSKKPGRGVYDTTQRAE